MLVPLERSYDKVLTHGAVLTPFNYTADPVATGYSAGISNSSTEDEMLLSRPSYTLP
jgi:hypothetical protein